MKSNSKDRIVVSIIVIVFLVTISSIGFFIINRNKAGKVGGTYGERIQEEL